MPSQLARCVLLLLATFLTTTCAATQCALQWLPGDGASMPRGGIYASVTWDPDGIGPLPVSHVVGGDFTIGTTQCHVAMYDGAQWTPLGTPTGSAITAMAVYNGDLVVAGNGKVCRLVGTSWQQIGTYAVTINSAYAYKMAVFGSELFLGGIFTTVNGFPANNIARWNGSSWSPLGTGVAGRVDSLAVYTYQNQNALFVGGAFGSAGGVTTNNLAVWTGTAWAATAGTNGPVHALAVRTSIAAVSSALFAGGDFTIAGGVAVGNVAQFQVVDNTWSPVGSLGAGSDPVRHLFVREPSPSTYELVACQQVQVSRWSGSVWTQLGPNLAAVQGLIPSTGVAPRVYALGYFDGRYTVGLADYFALLGGVYSWDGAAWQTMDGTGIDRKVLTVLPVGDDLLIGGAFRKISGVVVNGVAIGTANAWLPLGNGVTGGNGAVNALARLPNGDLVAGGSFTVAAGGVADRIARWNGTSWQPLGTGLDGTVNALAVLPNGHLVAGGSFFDAGGALVSNIARWNGSSWSWLGGGCGGAVRALSVLGNGDLLVAGSFTQVGSAGLVANRVARWSNGTWSTFGAGVDNSVNAIVVMPNGDVVVAGAFTNAGGAAADRLARWSGSAWHALPLTASMFWTDVRALGALPNGDLLVGSDRFQVPWPSGGFAGENLARLQAATNSWEPLRLGRDVFNNTADVVHAIAVTPDGDVVVGGYFHNAANAISANVARLVTTCPASAVSYGPSCTGSGGANVLTATTLPWDNTMLRTRATGMPAQGVVMTLFGFTQLAVPIAALLPEGAPGCDLLTTPDIVGLALPTAGVVDTTVFLAPSPSLLGATFFHQVVPFQGFGSGPLVITSTNGLALLVGSH